MNERQLWARRLRVRLDEIEQPHLDTVDGLRELLALQDLSGRRKIWRDVLDEKTYRKWLSLSDVYTQIEWSMS